MNAQRKCCRNPLHCIIPNYIFEKMMSSDDSSVRDSGLNSIVQSSKIRGAREARTEMGFAVTTLSENGRRTIYNCNNSWFLSDAVLARSENGTPSDDASANRLFQGLGVTRDFLAQVFDRNSLDDRGCRLDGYVHVGVEYNNAVFDGSKMLFGDGDGVRFTDFTKSLDVIAHELGHGVTQFTSNLEYQDQPGALNESFSDVFGSLVKQWSLSQSVAEADWLIGKDVWTPGESGDALRSMRSPGKAYANHPIFGTDPQPDHMKKYVHTTKDNGGVHINSGIPNKAFYAIAMGIGGNSWDISGMIWYDALKKSNRFTDFQQFADLTYDIAVNEWGGGTERIVADGWKEVGIKISGVPSFARGGRSRKGEDVSLADIMRELNKISSRVKSLEEKV